MLLTCLVRSFHVINIDYIGRRKYNKSSRERKKSHEITKSKDINMIYRCRFVFDYTHFEFGCSLVKIKDFTVALSRCHFFVTLFLPVWRLWSTASSFENCLFTFFCSNSHYRLLRWLRFFVKNKLKYWNRRWFWSHSNTQLCDGKLSNARIFCCE